MNTTTVETNALKVAKYNPRKVLQSGSKEYEQLKKSLKKFGTVVPIIINKDGTVISGHQRLNVLKELGIEKVEAVQLDIDERKEQQLNIALNKIEGRWDWQKLDEMLEQFTDEELQFTGFEDDNISTTNRPSQKNTKPSKKEAGFTIYMSFADKDTADRWIEENSLNVEFGDKDVITIDMEEQ